MENGKKTYNKLVRDKIPEIIEKNGEIPVTRILNKKDFKAELERKLFEEYNEVLSAEKKENRLEELADMLEIISTLSVIENSNLEQVINIMIEKRKSRGGFEKGIYLEKVLKK